MITMVAKLQAKPGQEDELKAILTDMVGKVKQHEADGVPVYSLHVSDEDPTVFLFYEQYNSPDALKAHGQTSHMQEMNQKLKGMLAGRPVIERYTHIAGVS